jgi:hypothetical protein
MGPIAQSAKETEGSRLVPTTCGREASERAETPSRLAHGVRQRRTRRPRAAAAAGGRARRGVPRRRLPPPLRRVLRRRPLPPLPLRRQPEEIRGAVWRLRGEGDLRVQALQGQLDDRVVSAPRPGVRQPVPLPYL